MRGAGPGSETVPDPEEAVKAIVALRKEGLSLKEASRRISEKTGISRKVLYDAVLERQEADEP